MKHDTRQTKNKMVTTPLGTVLLAVTLVTFSLCLGLILSPLILNLINLK